MKTLKTEGFPTNYALVEFIIDNNIAREDILWITSGDIHSHCLYYYS